MVRSVVCFALVCFSSCQSCGPLEAGRYACDPRSSDPEQCPGASRCGLEGFCHLNDDVSVPWRCNDASNCVNGYVCGLAPGRTSRECHDPMAADAGFACELQTDCVRGWHCGVEKVCYDRAQKMAYPCRRHVNDIDCAEGWRCGLENTCHDSALAAAYLCEGDGDCEQGWRCGLDLKCVNPERDALRAVTTQLGAPQKVNPQLLDHAPELFAVSPVQPDALNVARQLFSYFDRGNLNVLDLAVGGTPPIGTNPHRLQTLTDAGEVSAIAALGVRSFDRYGAVDPGSWTYLTRPDGGFQELHFRTTNNGFGFDGTPYRIVRTTAGIQFMPVTLGADTFRIGTTEDGMIPTLTAFARQRAAAYFYGWGALSQQTNDFGNGYGSDTALLGSAFAAPGNQIAALDLLTAHHVNSDGIQEPTECTIIADRRGLFVQQTELDRLNSPKNYFPQPLIVPPFTNQDCEADNGVPQSHRIIGLSSLGRDWVAVSAHPLDAGVAQTGDTEVALIDVRSWWEVIKLSEDYHPFRGCFTAALCKPDPNAFPAVQPVHATTTFGPCRVCQGQELVALSVVPSSQSTPRIEVRCRASGPDGGNASDTITELTQGPGTSCQRTTVELPSSLGLDPVRVDTSNAGQLAFAGPRGHLWAGRSSATAVPVFFDEAPTGALSDGVGTPVFIGPDRIGWYAGPPFGILAFPLSLQDGERPVAAVEGRRQAFVTGGRAVVTLEGVAPGNFPKPLAAADPAPTRFDAPYFSVLTARPDGGTTVVVSSGDVLHAANLQASKPLLSRAVVPSEGKAIISLLSLPKAGQVRVFALTSSALFEVSAQTDQLWSSVQAPLPPGTPLELWADESRGRIGYADGRVFALETRVQIGEALNKRVDDFAQLCGQAYALAEVGLFRLRRTPSAIGQWEAVGVDAGVPAEELVQGRMLPFAEADAGTTLYLFTRRGEAVRMPVSCP